MDAIKLSGLEPGSVFGYFEKICSIPHGSGHTKEISDYLVSFAQDHGFKYKQDTLNNVIIFAEGTCGKEDHQPLILQGHMDMVLQKDSDCDKNLLTDGLEVMHDDAYVFASGTTLGGDDGIALAYALALLDDKSIAHPPLEVVFTTDEETGMEGAAGIDLTELNGKMLVNIDSEDEGVFTVSCAGGARAVMHLPAERRAVYGPCVKLTVENLKGGHSGTEINKNRANANKIMAEFLSDIQKLMPVCITRIEGGSADNAIPRSCEVTMVPLGMYIDRINAVAETLQKKVREQYDEPLAVVRGDDVDALGGNALTTECSAKLIALMNAVPNGVQSMSDDIDGLVQTSLNLGVAQSDSSEIQLIFAVRSSVNEEKETLLKKLKDLAEFNGGSYSQYGDYPAWEYRKSSYLRNAFLDAYRDLYQKEAKVEAIHAGLECGLLGEKIQDLDCISVGPQMYDVHTSRERLNIASVERTWKLLLKVLANM